MLLGNYSVPGVRQELPSDVFSLLPARTTLKTVPGFASYCPLPYLHREERGQRTQLQTPEPNFQGPGKKCAERLIDSVSHSMSF